MCAAQRNTLLSEFLSFHLPLLLTYHVARVFIFYVYSDKFIVMDKYKNLHVFSFAVSTQIAKI